MRTFMILLATVATSLASPGYIYGAAPVGHDGRVVDTPEVAHAKAEHLAAHAKEASKYAYGYAYAPALSYVEHQQYAYAPIVAYHGSAAPLGHDGRVIETPEVAHAKAAHLQAHAQEAAKAGHGHAYDSIVYHYSPAHSYGYQSAAPLGHDGRVIETPEVAHAKAAHLQAHAQEAAKAAHGHAYDAVVYQYSPVHSYGYQSAAPLGHDGRVIETPEVALAKAAHLQAHAQEAAKHGYGHAHDAVVYQYSPVNSYGHPVAAPIGHDGRVVDTPEVAHAKAEHLAAHHAAAASSHHW
ncbi:cuticle protein 18.7-like [Diachasmimorpha longicaudata]|uniref:cuticle protein 18.7-like n=1 Tax=Diachasmimorpha longicaudata TaxID=58733 RepID=UPI0030B8BA00